MDGWMEIWFEVLKTNNCGIDCRNNEEYGLRKKRLDRYDFQVKLKFKLNCRFS